MGTETPGERHAMGKSQKNIQFDDDLAKVIEAHQRKCGASFTRIITASVLAYLFGEHGSSDPRWMGIALALEKGEISTGDIPLGLATAELEMANREVQMFRDGGMKEDEFALQAALARQGEAEERKKYWDEWIAGHKTPLEAVIEYFRPVGFHRAYVRHVSPAWDDPEERARRGLPPLGGETDAEQADDKK